MILSSAQVHAALDLKRLIIDPEPTPRVPAVGSDHCPYDTHSVDLRLASEISIPEPGIYAFDLGSSTDGMAKFLARNSRRVVLTGDQPYTLVRNQFILGRTIEEISLPILAEYKTCLAARIEGKSSRARCGLLIHFTAPTVHPGFNGTLTLEMINLGPANIILREGMAIAQLIVEEVTGFPAALNPSQFQGQHTPEGLTVGNGVRR